MLESIGIGQFVEWLDPIEPAIGKLDGALSVECVSSVHWFTELCQSYSLLSYGAQVGSWRIPPALRLS